MNKDRPVKKQRLSFRQIWNMNFAYLGIQFGWGLQMANMSAIYEYLGADPGHIPILWLAAPLTGLLIQPIVGQMSDLTWTRLGRRRPYLFWGAVLSAIALVAMPNSRAVWIAAALLWILDASINISMQPIRALVADVLPEEQHDAGFAMQSVFIGLGAVIASALPWLMIKAGLSPEAPLGTIPLPVTVSFYAGAVAFLGAVSWTVSTTKEYPPADLAAFARQKAEQAGVLNQFAEIFRSIFHSPKAMWQLGAVQFFTWLGLFCMWMFFSVAIARSVFQAPNEKSPLYLEGIAWGGICFAAYSLVTFFFAFMLPKLAQRWGRRLTHALCLAAGGVALIAVVMIQNKWLLLLSMVGVGIAWASILAMPYAILTPSLPKDRYGVYMGVFNLFIVIPEIIASLALGPVLEHVFANDRLAVVVAGGGCMLVAAVLMSRVQEPQTAQQRGVVSGELVA